MTEQTRYSLAALAAVACGVLALVPHLPAPLSAVLLLVFVGLAPGCATLAWTGPPGISRAALVPALGLSAVVIVSAVAATVGWWSPRGVFAIVALPTLWSVVPHLPVLVGDLAAEPGSEAVTGTTARDDTAHDDVHGARR